MVGFALSCYPVAVERGWMERDEAMERTLATLRFFWNSSQSEDVDATGYKGFYYHFLDLHTGRRAWTYLETGIRVPPLWLGRIHWQCRLESDSGDWRM